MVKKNACIFISGKGSNLKNLIKKTRDYNFPINIKLVISNKKDAKGLNYARKYSIPYWTISYNKRKKFEQLSFQLIQSKNID